MFKPQPCFGEPPSLMERHYVAEDLHFPPESRMLASQMANVQVVFSPAKLHSDSEEASLGDEGVEGQDISSSVQKIKSTNFTREKIHLWPENVLKWRSTLLLSFLPFPIVSCPFLCGSTPGFILLLSLIHFTYQLLKWASFMILHVFPVATKK